MFLCGDYLKLREFLLLVKTITFHLASQFCKTRVIVLFLRSVCFHACGYDAVYSNICSYVDQILLSAVYSIFSLLRSLLELEVCLKNDYQGVVHVSNRAHSLVLWVHNTVYRIHSVAYTRKWQSPLKIVRIPKRDRNLMLLYAFLKFTTESDTLSGLIPGVGTLLLRKCF